MKKRPKSANRRLAVPTPAVKPTRGDDVARNVGIAALFVLAASSLLPWGGFLGRNYIGLVGEGRIIGPASLIAGLCLCFLPARMKGWSTAAYFIALWVGINLVAIDFRPLSVRQQALSKLHYPVR